MNEMDKQAARLAVLEGAFALLVEHLAKGGALDKAMLMADLQRLSDLPGRDVSLLQADQRLLGMLRLMR